VPTTRPRLTITETDDIARALDDAGERWPEVEARSQLLLRLIALGHSAIREGVEAETNRRRSAIRTTSGALTGAYEPGYLDRLREDWPE
jgi:hypothetical protein